MDKVNNIHLAIIPDGNRRWAKKQLLKPWQGHERAVNNSRKLVEWCRNTGKIDVLTFWGFSTENWGRSHEETKQLMKIFEKYLRNERSVFVENKTRLIHSGRKDRIPQSLAKLLEEVSAETTREDYVFTLNLAIDYGGRDEIVRSLNKISNRENITPDSFRKYLDHPEVPDIDLIIRTSGEYRMSNFFLWQAAYAEWAFLPKLYPELTEKDLNKVLEEYGQRHRRFGS